MEFNTSKVCTLTKEQLERARSVTVSLDVSQGNKYSNLIVYIPVKTKELPKKVRGRFEEVSMNEVIPGTLLTEQGLRQSTKMTRNGFRVASVYVTNGSGGYVRVRCFARVESCFPKDRLFLVVEELNDRMRRCHPLTKDFDAEAAIAQDPFRVLNMKKSDFNIADCRACNQNGAHSFSLVPTREDLVNKFVPHGFNELKAPIIHE